MMSIVLLVRSCVIVVYAKGENKEKKMNKNYFERELKKNSFIVIKDI